MTSGRDGEFTPPRYNPERLNSKTGSLPEDYYERVRRGAIDRKPILEQIVRPRTGFGFALKRGNLVRITCIEGPQVVDLNAFNMHDTREALSCARTRMVNGLHLKEGDYIWSKPPYARPMMKLVRDTVEKTGGKLHTHDLTFSQCDREYYKLLTGRGDVPSCHDNLHSAVAEYGITTDMVHDPVNLFMYTGLNEENRMYYEDPVARQGDYVEIVADMDCVIGISVCPGNSSGKIKRPIAIQLFELDGGVPAS